MKKFKKPDPRRVGQSSRPGNPQRPARPNRGSGGGHRPQSGSGRTPAGRAVAGLHAVRELLKVRPGAVAELWLRDNYKESRELMELAENAQRRRVSIVPQASASLDRIVNAHQGVVAFATEAPELDFAALKSKAKSQLILLDEVEDPHNLGAVLRTAWLFGVDGVLLPENRAASLNATVSKVAQGATEHVPVYQDSGLLETIKMLKQDGYWIYGLSHRGEATIFETELPDKVLWVLGSESSGIRKPIERECDQLLRIPQTDPEASFNVSVAAAIAVSEAYRQVLTRV